MHLIGLNKFRVITSSFEENLDKNKFKEACQYCLITAKHKALDVIKNLEIKGTMNKGTILISSDTIVEIDNTILEKPKDRDDAIKMLTLLRGRTHQVHTSICIYSNMNNQSKLLEVDSFVSTSSITFSNFSDDDLFSYVSTKEPYDKAGSYGIQGLGAMFVESIKGDYFTIMGFPVFLLSSSLASLYHNKKL
jgi:septum formation protein